MPSFDLGPGDYRERKPKGWRWKLPWSHPEDTKLPMALSLFWLCCGIYVYLHRGEFSDTGILYLAGALIGFLFGGFLQLWLRD